MVSGFAQEHPDEWSELLEDVLDRADEELERQRLVKLRVSQVQVARLMSFGPLRSED